MDSYAAISVGSDTKLKNDSLNSSYAHSTEIKSKANEWVEYKAIEDGRTYFYNPSTGQSYWDKLPTFVEVHNKIKVSIIVSEAEGSAKVISEEKDGSNIALSQAMENESFAAQTKSKIHNSEIPEGMDRGNKTNSGRNIEDEKERSPVSMQELPASTVCDKQESSVRKIVNKSSPVSSTPIRGTPWCVVWTGDRRVFFFNPSIKKSVWQKPAELKGRTDVERLIQCPPQHAVSTAAEVTKRAQSHSAPESKKLKFERNVQTDEEKAAKIINAELAASVYMPLDERMKQFRASYRKRRVSIQYFGKGSTQNNI